MAGTIYDDILANIDAEKKAWCQNQWTGLQGQSLSRCLVSHIDYATGVAYTTTDKNGKIKHFVSKSKAKWRKRNQVLRDLVAVMTPKELARSGYNAPIEGGFLDPQELPVSDESQMEWWFFETQEHQDVYTDEVAGDFIVPRIHTRASEVLVDFNDQSGTTKASVRRLLQRAAKRYSKESK